MSNTDKKITVRTKNKNKIDKFFEELTKPKPVTDNNKGQK